MFFFGTPSFIIFQEDDATREKSDEEEEEEVEDQAEQPGSSKDRKRWSKSELYSAYKGRGPHRMCFDFLHAEGSEAGIGLRQELVIISELGSALNHKYADDLDSQRDRLGALKWAASRASPSSCLGTLVSILDVVGKGQFGAKLRLAPRTGVVLQPHQCPDDIMAMELAWNFAVNLCGNYAWGQQLYAWTLPVAVAGLLDDSSPA